MSEDLDGSVAEIEPLLRALNERFSALLRKQKHHDREVADLRTQLDIEGRGFRSIKEELAAKGELWGEEKKGYDAQILALRGSGRQLQREKESLEAEIRILKGLERRVVCLIDGDGTIFSRELLVLGEQGGFSAARELTRLIFQYLKDSFQPPPSPPELSVYIFLHKRGLMDALGAAGYHVEKSKFDDFVAGFNHAGQRFMMVDVGAGKENADSKLRVFLQDSIRSPQTWKVFFGGSHDNGYAPDLQALITDGLKEKLILLPGYTQMASRIRELDFSILAILGLFMPEKLPSFKSLPLRPLQLPSLHSGNRLPTTRNGSSPGSTAKGPGQTGKLNRTPSLSDSTSVKDSSLPSSPALSIIQLGQQSNGASKGPVNSDIQSKPGKTPKTKFISRECFSFHLAGSCSFGEQCDNKHTADLKPGALAKLRADAQQKTCTIMLRYGNCKYGAKCIHSHKCPKGSECPYLCQNKCKFGPIEMH